MNSIDAIMLIFVVATGAYLGRFFTDQLLGSSKGGILEAIVVGGVTLVLIFIFNYIIGLIRGGPRIK
jgi:hypothetical protein